MTENELYHFGVKGMKWGVRKSKSSSGSSGSSNSKQKQTKQKSEKKYSLSNNGRVKQVKNAYEKGKNYGTLGVAATAVGSASQKKSKFFIKGAAVGALNLAANAYITQGKGPHYVKVGVDYVRKAAITGLSLSAAADVIQEYANIGAAVIGSGTRYK